MRIRASIQRFSAEQKGVSFLVALMFVLVVGMIATVVLSSAVVNAERIKPQREDQQAYLAVVSALNSADYLLDEYICSPTTGLTVTVNGSNVAGLKKSADDLGLAQWVIEEQRKLHTAGASDTCKYVRVNAKSGQGINAPPVLLIFTMTNSGISVSACEDVWADSETVPATADERSAKLVEKADYANELTKKQVAVQDGTSTLTWHLKSGSV